MRIAIFPQDETGRRGFSTEHDPDFEWHKKHYHVIELPEKEVKELKKAFTAYEEAQERIDGIFKKIADGELKTVGMLETEEWINRLKAKHGVQG